MALSSRSDRRRFPALALDAADFPSQAAPPARGRPSMQWS